MLGAIGWGLAVVAVLYLLVTYWAQRLEEQGEPWDGPGEEE